MPPPNVPGPDGYFFSNSPQQIRFLKVGSAPEMTLIAKLADRYLGADSILFWTCGNYCFWSHKAQHSILLSQDFLFLPGAQVIVWRNDQNCHRHHHSLDNHIRLRRYLHLRNWTKRCLGHLGSHCGEMWHPDEAFAGICHIGFRYWSHSYYPASANGLKLLFSLYMIKADLGSDMVSSTYYIYIARVLIISGDYICQCAKNLPWRLSSWSDCCEISPLLLVPYLLTCYSALGASAARMAICTMILMGEEYFWLRLLATTNCLEILILRLTEKVSRQIAWCLLSSVIHWPK